MPGGYFEKGSIKCGIEIVNTHKISEKKKNQIQETIKGTSCVAVIEISAQWIMNQKNKPDIIELTKYISAQEYIESMNYKNPVIPYHPSTH